MERTMATNLFSLANNGIGFDHMFDRLEKLSSNMIQNTSYPPYNIKKVEDNKYVIEVAVAGFGKQDLELELQDSTLTIKGNTTLDTVLEDGVDVTYLYRGIANRNFTRKFTLADSVEIKNAQFINGLLKVWLENVIPESKKPKKIDISEPAGKVDKDLLT
jgi:molecular chaperone IbpA